MDFNVEMDNGRISDDSRIRGALPTIEYLRKRGAVAILCSHLGRPGGKVVEDMRLAPVGARLSELLGAEVTWRCGVWARRWMRLWQLPARATCCCSRTCEFHPEEEKNDPEFALALASLAEVFVEDGFGVSHRAHASTEGVTRFLPSVAGSWWRPSLPLWAACWNLRHGRS